MMNCFTKVSNCCIIYKFWMSFLPTTIYYVSFSYFLQSRIDDS